MLLCTICKQYSIYSYIYIVYNIVYSGTFFNGRQLIKLKSSQRLTFSPLAFNCQILEYSAASECEVMK